jgi:hypothetical protein
MRMALYLSPATNHELLITFHRPTTLRYLLAEERPGVVLLRL